MRRLFLLLAAGVGLWVGQAFCATAWADVVYFKSGQTLKGLIVEEHRDRIFVSTEQGEQSILLDQVDELFYDDPERNYLYLGNQAIANADFVLAKNFFQKALQIAPRFEEARDALSYLSDLKGKLLSGPETGNLLQRLKERRWGLTLERQEPYATVQAVEEGFLAARSKLKVKDSLVSAWGESLGYLPLEDVAKALLGPAGSPLKLVIQREVQLIPPSNSSDSDNPLAALQAGQSWPGMMMGMERMGLTVLKVGPNGVAAAAGLAPRDRIVAIAGSATRYLPLGEAIRRVSLARAQGVTLLIQRDVLVTRE